MAEGDIRKAINCFSIFSRNGEIRVELGKKQILREYSKSLIEDETNFHPHDHKIMKASMVEEMVNFLQEIASQRYNNPEIDVIGFFNENKGKFCRETLGAPLTTYTLAFPLNIINLEKFRSCFNVSETSIIHIERENWKTKYEEPAREKDDTHLEQFLDRESPNQIKPDVYGNEKFTFWKAEYDARDSYYALYAVQNVIRFFLARLNYSLQKNHGKTKTAGSKYPEYARLSPLQEPYFYLIYNGSEYDHYHPMDFEYRRRGKIVGRDIEEHLELFDRIPSLNTVNPDLDSIEKILMNVLLSYQEGVTTPHNEQSFFSFWRGIENLAQVEKGQSHTEVMDRVEPIFRMQIEGELFRKHEKKALKQIRNARSQLVHDGPNLPYGDHQKKVTESKQLLVKRVLDNLLEFYIEMYEDGYNSCDLQIFLKYMTESEAKNRRSLNVLRDVIEYRSNEEDP